MRLGRINGRLLALTFLLSVFLTARSPGVRAADLFASLPGNWTGTGAVLKLDGTSETLRCRAK